MSRYLSFYPGYAPGQYRGPFQLSRGAECLTGPLVTLQDAANAFLVEADTDPTGLVVTDARGTQVAWGDPAETWEPLVTFGSDSCPRLPEVTP
jgi:hypothetical protein